MAARNGKGTFHALKRELVYGRLVGSVRSVGELAALRELINEFAANFNRRREVEVGFMVYTCEMLKGQSAVAAVDARNAIESAIALIHDDLNMFNMVISRDLRLIAEFMVANGFEK